jgi:hypothetical protein
VSLIYLLLNLKFGFLPWSEFDKTNKDKYKKKVLESKENFDIDNFFGHNCQDLKDIYNVIFNLDPNEKPNYAYLKSLFMKIIEKNGGPNTNINFRFNWENHFYYYMKEFSNKKNIQGINDIIYSLFAGYPEKLVLEYLNQFYF